MRRISKSGVFAFVLFSVFIALLTLILTDVSAVFAQAADAAPAAGAAPAGPQQHTPFQFILNTVNFFLIAFFVYYVLVLRPSQLKQEQQARFLKELKKDEEVVTTGGIIGRVASITPEAISVEVAPGTRIRFRPENVSPYQVKKSAGVEPRKQAPEKEKERKTK